MRCRSLGAGALFGALLLAQGCASTSEIVTRYGAGETAGERLLLASRSPEPALRRQWENACAPQLRKQGFEVITSMDVLPAWFESGTDELERWAQANGVPGILLAELTSLLPEPAHYNPSEVLNGNNLHSDVQIIVPAKAYRETRDAPPPAQNIEVELIDAGGHIQWRAEIITREANNIPAIGRSQCTAVARVLREGAAPAR